MERNQVIAWVILVLFSLFAAFLAFNSDSIALAMKTGNFWQALAYSYLLNPANLMIIAGLVYANKNKSIIRGLLASFLIIFAVSAVSFPHLVGRDGLPQDLGAYGSSDTVIIAKMNDLGVKHPISWFAYYIILPVLAVLLALWLLGFRTFVKKFSNGG